MEKISPALTYSFAILYWEMNVAQLKMSLTNYFIMCIA